VVGYEVTFEFPVTVTPLVEVMFGGPVVTHAFLFWTCQGVVAEGVEAAGIGGMECVACDQAECGALCQSVVFGKDPLGPGV
jgi:hypothetical protein